MAGADGPYFAKTAFELDWERQEIRCPNDVVLPFEVGGLVQFPAASCRVCPLRERCTRSAQGRSVSIHPDEKLMEELRERQLTAQGRAKLRERTAVEHGLAHVGIGKGAVRAIAGFGRTCWICGGWRWCIICM